MKTVTIHVDCQAGVCPICGSELEYTGTNHLVGYHNWTCTCCKATGEEGYPNGDMNDPLDAEHYAVQLKDGTSVTILPATPEKPAETPKLPVTVDVVDFLEDVCPVCGGTYETTGKESVNNYGIDYEWECRSCGAIGWSEYSEETTNTFNGSHYDVKLKDGTPVKFNIHDPDATIGRIDYLTSAGRVAHSKEYANEDAFVKEVTECNDTGVPIVIYLYRDTNGNTISTDFINDLGSLPAGFCIVDHPQVWKIPVSWEMCGYAYVTAPTLAEAVEKVRSNNDDIPLPDDASYVDDSFAPSYDDVEEIRSLHNDNRPDSGGAKA